MENITTVNKEKDELLKIKMTPSLTWDSASAKCFVC